MNEFARPIRIDRLPDEPAFVEASAEERAALAKRFGVVALTMLTGEAMLERLGEGIRVTGSIRARIEQDCAVSGDTFATDIAEDFALLYLDQLPTRSDEDEYELSEDELDHLVLEGDAVDVGEAMAQTLAMAIDPYARGPNADVARLEAGLESDEDRPASGPLAEALKAIGKG